MAIAALSEMTSGTVVSSTSQAEPLHGRVDAKLSKQPLASRSEAADGSSYLATDLPVRQRVVSFQEQQDPSIFSVEASKCRTDAVRDLTTFVGAHCLVLCRRRARPDVVEVSGHQPGAAATDLGSRPARHH